MINFSDAIEVLNSYKGSEKKKTLIYNNKKYLVKFPDPIREKNKNISYINNAFSEYIGSNIFKIVGFETQNTLLGKYLYNGKKINYMTYIKSLKNEECNNAIKRILKKISIEKIDNFINEISCIGEKRKEFYKKLIKYRYEIIKDIYNKLNKN